MQQHKFTTAVLPLIVVVPRLLMHILRLVLYIGSYYKFDISAARGFNAIIPGQLLYDLYILYRHPV